MMQQGKGGSDKSTTQTVPTSYYEACPPRMSDGRNFTQYTPTCQSMPANMSSNQLRAYLVSNAEQLIAYNRDIASRQGCTMSCFDLSNSGTALPEVEYMWCDKRKCHTVPGYNMGLGMGRKASQ